MMAVSDPRALFGLRIMNANPALIQRLAVQNRSQTRPLTARQVKNEESGETIGTIFIYDIIDEWFGISARMVVDAMIRMEQDGADRIVIRLNTPGGSVFDARAIVTQMRLSSVPVDTQVDGLAASAGSWIATAGKTRSIADGASIMIHNSWAFISGNAADMEATARALREVDDSIIREFAQTTNLEPDVIREMMDAETWISSERAVADGFSDTLIAEAAGAKNASRWNLSAYRNAPKFAPESPEESDPDWERLNAQVGLLENEVL